MTVLHLNFLAESKDLKFCLENNGLPSQQQFYFLNIFLNIFKNDNTLSDDGVININLQPIQRNSQNLCDNIKKFVKEIEPQGPLNKLIDYFKLLKEDEPFIIISSSNISQEERVEYGLMLQSLNTGENFEKLKYDTENLFGKLLNTWQIQV